VYVTMTFVFTMSMINLGSTVAFTQILSLGVSAMLTTYAISIFFVALKRIRGEPLLPSKFNLGKWGLPVNLISLVFLLFLFIFAFFPPAPSPTPGSMNWAIMTYSVVVIFALLYYVFRSQYVYVGPVEYIRRTF
jgi:choline transport protein